MSTNRAKNESIAEANLKFTFSTLEMQQWSFVKRVSSRPTKDPQRKKKIYKLECEELCSRRFRFAFWSQSILQVASSCVNLSVLIPRSPFTIRRRFVFAASHTAAWVRRCVRSGCSLRIQKTAETPLKNASVFQLSSCLQDSAFLIFLFICFELFFQRILLLYSGFCAGLSIVRSLLL